MAWLGLLVAVDGERFYRPGLFLIEVTILPFLGCMHVAAAFLTVVMVARTKDQRPVEVWILVVYLASIVLVLFADAASVRPMMMCAGLVAASFPLISAGAKLERAWRRHRRCV